MVAKQSIRKIGTVVARAIQVARQIRFLSTELEELKETIREAGISAKSDGEKVELASVEGTATVVFPKPKLIIREGAVPESLKAILPEPVWSRIFTVRISPADEAAAIWNTMTGPSRRALDRVLDRKESTPSVLLPK